MIIEEKLSSLVSSYDSIYSHTHLIENSTIIEFNTNKTMNMLINRNSDVISFNRIFDNFLDVGLEYLDYCILKVKSVDEEEYFNENEIKTILLNGFNHQLSMKLQLMNNLFLW